MERSKTENVIGHIEKLMYDTDEKYINIKAFISDLAGKYIAIQYVILYLLFLLSILCISILILKFLY